jgi:hypothetical protein
MTIRRLVDELAATAVSERACNQYARDGGDARHNAVRRRNLRLYLEELARIRPSIVLIGEAPSYRGGRLTGIPFVSETVMLAGVETRSAPGHVLGAASGYHKATDGPKLSTEASATMVWGTIRTLDPLPLLWNAFPFHPFHPGEPNTNRCPTPAELEIGQQAAASLGRMGVAHVKVRHPSMGGKNQFVAGMAELSQTLQP